VLPGRQQADKVDRGLPDVVSISSKNGRQSVIAVVEVNLSSLGKHAVEFPACYHSAMTFHGHFKPLPQSGRNKSYFRGIPWDQYNCSPKVLKGTFGDYEIDILYKSIAL